MESAKNPLNPRTVRIFGWNNHSNILINRVPMRRLLRIFRRPPIRMGSVDNAHIRTTPIRNAGFVSFFAGSGCVSARNCDYQDNRLRRQKRLRTLAVVSVTAFCTWIVVESARAISTF